MMPACRQTPTFPVLAARHRYNCSRMAYALVCSRVSAIAPARSKTAMVPVLATRHWYDCSGAAAMAQACSQAAARHRYNCIRAATVPVLAVRHRYKRSRAAAAMAPASRRTTTVAVLAAGIYLASRKRPAGFVATLEEPAGRWSAGFTGVISKARATIDAARGPASRTHASTLVQGSTKMWSKT